MNGFDWLLLVSLALIGWQFAGYPALVILLARFRRTPPLSADTPRLSASLIVPAYNEAAIIASKVENSLDISYGPLTLAIIADGSDDGTEVAAARAIGDRGTVLHDHRRQGKAAALNRAVAVTEGDILIFSDANTWMEPDVLHHLMAPFADPRVGMVSGRKTVVPRDDSGTDRGFARSEGIYWRYEDRIRRAEDALGNTVATVGELMAVRRALWEPIPSWVVNDDAYLALRVMRSGHDVRYARAAVTREYASLRTGDEVQRRRRMAAGRWAIIAHPSCWPLRRPLAMLAVFSHKWLRLLLPFLFASAFLANVLSVLLDPGRPVPLVLLVLQIAFHLAALAGGFGEGRRGGKLLRICHYIDASNLTSLLGFFDALRRRSSVLWAKAER